MKLNQLTLVQAEEGLKEKKFSSLELTRACLARIKKVEKKINAFITISEEKALKEAEDADRFLEERKELKSKPLLGIPIGIKDIFVTEGIRTTAASKVLASYIPQYDATVVRKLKEAGAVIIGKANMDAWAHGASGENSDFGPSRNPWDLDYVPGGSSSGSAAAVAADECLAATGTDTGGSIRLPAAFCGLVGLKPTYGRVSRYGVIAMASSLDSPGCLTKTVFDQALMLQVFAGHDDYDATTPQISVPDYASFLGRPIAGLKVGLPKEYFGSGTTPEIKEALKKAIKKIEELGARPVGVSLPHTQYAVACYYITVSSEISSNLGRYDGIRYGFPRNRFSDEAKRRIMLGTYSLSAGYYDAFYLKAQKVRSLLKKDFEAAFAKVDVLIGPTSPTPPFKLGEKVADPLLMYLCDIFTCPINLSGLPSLSLPCGFSSKGLPLGMQIIGPQFSEGLLLRTAFAFEQATEWHHKKPKLYC